MSTQRYLSEKGMIFLITFINLFVPLSIDMYLPALPEMGEALQAGPELSGMTLTIFFFTFSAGVVLFGPVTDKAGRKPVLLGGSILYGLSSLLCAFSPSIYVLLLGRFSQALAAGAMTTASTALIKDAFDKNRMGQVLALTQALSVIGPMAGPLLGGFLLLYTDWRGAFLVLTLFGLVSLIFSSLLTETLPREKRIQEGFVHSLFHIVKILRVRAFMQPLLMFSLLAAPYMGYLAVSSFIYEGDFHLTPQEYALAYGVNSLAAIAGPFLFMVFRQIWSERKYIFYIFALCVISMAGLLFFTGGPLSFFLSFLPFTVMEASMRPFAMEMLLSKVEKDVGSASAMINFMPSLAGSVGMALVVLPFAGYVMNLGLMMAVTTFISIILYLTDKEWERAGTASMERH